ncbi:MAG: glycosyltransferase [Candidatus Dormiibacterota bacterium]
MTAPSDELGRLQDELEAARRRITELEAELQRVRADLILSTDSASARIALSAARKVRRLVPPGSRRQQSLHTAASRTVVLIDHGPAAVLGVIRRDRELRRAIGVADTPAARRRQYRRWLASHTPTATAIARMRREAAAFEHPPVISVVMPVHDPDRAWLEAAIDSVLSQAYPHLELCIADDGSTKPYVREVLEGLDKDARVRVAFRDRRGGIGAASNSAIELATGEFIGFLDHDDVLRPHALFAMAAYIRDHADADVVYSDEDKLLADGSFGLPAFKPDYSPELLLGGNYFNHFTVMRRSLLHDVGNFREGFDGSQDHDLVLRVSERARRVGHVADVLYAWRMTVGSTAISADRKPLADDAGRRAVDDALRRRGVDAHAEFGPSAGLYIPRYAITGTPTVDVLIVARVQTADSTVCAANIEQFSTYADRRVTVVSAGDGVSRAVNRAARELHGDHMVLLDASVRVLTPQWIEAMLELSQRDDVAAVGALLRYPDGSVAHQGVVVGRLGIATGVDPLLHIIRETSAVSAACLMTRRDVFDKVSGLDERFRERLFDIDYCMRVRALGNRVLCTPLAELTWGGADQGVGAEPRDPDAVSFRDRWETEGGIPDPYVNANVLWPNPLSLRLG